MQIGERNALDQVVDVTPAPRALPPAALVLRYGVGNQGPVRRRQSDRVLGFIRCSPQSFASTAIAGISARLPCTVPAGTHLLDWARRLQPDLFRGQIVTDN